MPIFLIADGRLSPGKRQDALSANLSNFLGASKAHFHNFCMNRDVFCDTRQQGEKKAAECF